MAIMGNRVMISHLHNRQPVEHRFNAEKRASKWRIGYDSDQLRTRTLRYMGSNMTAYSVWKASNCGLSYNRWGVWMAGDPMPAKYHMALDRFLTEHGA